LHKRSRTIDQSQGRESTGFSVLCYRVLPRASGYEGRNYQRLSEIPIASDTPAYPPRHSQRHSQSRSHAVSGTTIGWLRWQVERSGIRNLPVKVFGTNRGGGCHLMTTRVGTRDPD